MAQARSRAEHDSGNPFRAVGLAYVEFALEKPAFFRAMWHEETIYSNDPVYVAAADALGAHLRGGFADTLEDRDPGRFSSQELLAWSAVHGLANLFVDGPVGRNRTKAEKMTMAGDMLAALSPAFAAG